MPNPGDPGYPIPSRHLMSCRYRCRRISKSASKFGPCHRQQNGAALIIALLMLIVLLMLGIAAMHIGLQSEKMGRNRRDRQIAWQAAEAALQDAEYDIGNPGSSRYALFGAAQQQLTVLALKSCRPGGAVPGLCLASGDTRHPVWHRMGQADGAPDLEYGKYSGRLMQTGIGALPSQLPRYLIEILPSNAGKAPDKQGRRYRISALGFGPDRNTQVMLQSIYRRQASPTVPDTPPSARLSWREIMLWGSA